MSHSCHTKSIPCHANKSISYCSRNRSIFSLQSSQNRTISMIYLLAPLQAAYNFPLLWLIYRFHQFCVLYPLPTKSILRIMELGSFLFFTISHIPLISCRNISHHLQNLFNIHPRGCPPYNPLITSNLTFRNHFTEKLSLI